MENTYTLMECSTKKKKIVLEKQLGWGQKIQSKEMVKRLGFMRGTKTQMTSWDTKTLKNEGDRNANKW